MHIKQTHISTARPNLLKEHVSPTHGLTARIKHENTTSCIAHLTYNANIKDITPNKRYSGLIENHFEMPYVSYCKPLATVKKKIVKTLIFIILISISSCSGMKKMTEIETTEFKLVESDFVILPFNKDWHWIFKDVKTTGLTQSELIEIENILKIVVEENNERQKINLKKHNEEYPKNKWKETGFELELKGKKRQYVPVINEKGEKEIWINFFCNDWGSDSWKTDLMIVDDGGNCYFNLKVNLTNKTYSKLMINGYA